MSKRSSILNISIIKRMCLYSFKLPRNALSIFLEECDDTCIVEYLKQDRVQDNCVRLGQGVYNNIKVDNRQLRVASYHLG